MLAIQFCSRSVHSIISSPVQKANIIKEKTLKHTVRKYGRYSRMMLTFHPTIHYNPNRKLKLLMLVLRDLLRLIFEGHELSGCKRYWDPLHFNIPSFCYRTCKLTETFNFNEAHQIGVNTYHDRRLRRKLANNKIHDQGKNHVYVQQRSPQRCEVCSSSERW